MNNYLTLAKKGDMSISRSWVNMQVLEYLGFTGPTDKLRSFTKSLEAAMPLLYGEHFAITGSRVEGTFNVMLYAKGRGAGWVQASCSGMEDLAALICFVWLMHKNGEHTLDYEDLLIKFVEHG
jgi:hypothetical protein